MKLSDGERLGLLMLCDIYEKTKAGTEFDPDLIRNLIFNDHLWALRWVYAGINFSREPDPPEVKEVADILDMWSFIEWGADKMTPADKARVATETGGVFSDMKFRGFDGNNETEHMSIADTLINKLDRFATFAGRGLNSHMPSLDTYNRMLPVFERMRGGLGGGHLSTDQIIAILKEAVHPSHR